MNLAELYDVTVLRRADLTERQRSLVEPLIHAGRLTYHNGKKHPQMRDPKLFGLCIRLLATECALAQLLERINISQLPDEYAFLLALLHAEYERISGKLRARPQLKPKYREAWAMLELVHVYVSDKTRANPSALAYEALTRLAAMISKSGLAADAQSIVADCVRGQPAFVRRGSPLADRIRTRHYGQAAEMIAEAIDAKNPLKQSQAAFLSALSVEDRTRRKRIVRVARYIKANVRRIRRRIALCYASAVIDRKLPFDRLRQVIGRITNPPEHKLPITQPWRYFVKRLKRDFTEARIGIYYRREVIRALKAKYDGNVDNALTYEIVGAMGVWQKAEPAVSFDV